MDEVDPEPDDAEAAFLDALWEALETATEIAVSAEVMEQLDEVLCLCDAAGGLIRSWRDIGSSA